MSPPRVRFEAFSRWQARGRPARVDELDRAFGVGLRSAVSPKLAADWTHAVMSARDAWTEDFGGEQFALGRAFYTHLETGRTKRYFEGASASDALVERVLPGVQDETLALVASLVGGAIRRRRGFCGPGVHVFPSGGKVAKEGGVVHFDLEGLTEHHLARGARAITLVVMLAPATRGGGLRLWDRIYRGRSDTDEETRDVRHTTVRYGAGDALLVDSRRLHQIRPFSGDRDRVSITVHAAEIDRGVWEAWF